MVNFFIYILILFPAFLSAQTAEHKAQKVKLHFSLPHINFFHHKPLNTIKNNAGFWGISTGIDYNYTDKQFLNLTLSTLTTLSVPVPAAVRFTEDYELSGSTYFSISNNYRFKRFSIGYGLSAGKNTWEYVFINKAKDRLKINYNFIGLIIPAYLRIRKGFNLGVIYRPTFLQLSETTKFKYGHLISIDFAIKI